MHKSTDRKVHGEEASNVGEDVMEGKALKMGKISWALQDE